MLHISSTDEWLIGDNVVKLLTDGTSVKSVKGEVVQNLIFFPTVQKA